MSRTTGRVQRDGVIHFGDASISIWEEGIPREWDARKVWETAFKKQVFHRIIQTLNRLGWVCVIPMDKVKTYSLNFARTFRECSKGDLKGELKLCGRTIEFQMWQGINTPTRADHGGRYEWDKEGIMPYPLRLEMERTRRRIREYLLNVFTGYTFKAKEPKIGLYGVTALEFIQREQASSWHYKTAIGRREGDDAEYNNKSADKLTVMHGERVWFADQSGRICTGIAHYNINNMWWVITGRYDRRNIACFEIFVECPADLRTKRNARQRRNRLESLLTKATTSMNFERAAVLRDILFPKAEPLYMIWHKEKHVYFGVNYCGYTNSETGAGKYTREELKPYLKGELENKQFKAVLICGEPLAMAA